MKKTCLGFTLIELLIAVSIMGILFSLGFAQYMKFNRQQILTQAVLELKTNLLNAQNMALTGKKTCSGAFDGIWVEFSGGDDTYTFYSSCNNKDPTRRVQVGLYQFFRGVQIETYPTDGILFKVLTGGTDLGDTTIILSLSGVEPSGVKVSSSGKIELVP